MFPNPAQPIFFCLPKVPSGISAQHFFSRCPQFCSRDAALLNYCHTELRRQQHFCSAGEKCLHGKGICFENLLAKKRTGLRGQGEKNSCAVPSGQVPISVLSLPDSTGGSIIEGWAGVGLPPAPWVAGFLS